MVKYHKKK